MLCAGEGGGLCSAGTGCAGDAVGPHRELQRGDARRPRPAGADRAGGPHRARLRLLLPARRPQGDIGYLGFIQWFILERTGFIKIGPLSK